MQHRFEKLLILSNAVLRLIHSYCLFVYQTSGVSYLADAFNKLRNFVPSLLIAWKPCDKNVNFENNELCSLLY